MTLVMRLNRFFNISNVFVEHLNGEFTALDGFFDIGADQGNAA